MAASMATTLSASHALTASAPLLLFTPSRRTAASLPVVTLAANAPPKAADLSRRQVVLSLSALSVALFSSSQRQADARESRDIPLFGLKKAKKISEQVVEEVKELVKEGRVKLQR